MLDHEVASPSGAASSGAASGGGFLGGGVGGSGLGGSGLGGSVVRGGVVRGGGLGSGRLGSSGGGGGGLGSGRLGSSAVWGGFPGGGRLGSSGLGSSGLGSSGGGGGGGFFSCGGLGGGCFGCCRSGGDQGRLDVARLRFGDFMPIEDFDDAPLLVFGERAAFFDPYLIAEDADVGLVVRLVLLAAAEDFLVERVGDGALDAHDDGLLHLVAHDDAGALFACHG